MARPSPAPPRERDVSSRATGPPAIFHGVVHQNGDNASRRQRVAEDRRMDRACHGDRRAGARAGFSLGDDKIARMRLWGRSLSRSRWPPPSAATALTPARAARRPGADRAPVWVVPARIARAEPAPPAIPGADRARRVAPKGPVQARAASPARAAAPSSTAIPPRIDLPARAALLRRRPFRRRT